MAIGRKKGETQVFVRKATGLVERVGLLDAISINMGDMSAGAAVATIGFSTILFGTMAGMNLVWASILAFILSIPQIVVYTMLNRRVPRTGGDYVWVSRIFGGAFGGSLAFAGYVMETLAFFALIAMSAVFAIGSVGVSLGHAGFLGLALPSNTPGAARLPQFGIAAIIFAALIAVNIFRPKVGYRLVTIFVLSGIAIMLIGMAVLFNAGHTGVANYINYLNTSQGFNMTYSQVASSYHGSHFNWLATLLLLPFFGIYVYPWLSASPAVSSEIKGKSGIRWAVPIAAFIIMLLVTGAFGAMYYAGGFNFISAALTNPSLVYNYSFNFWTLAMGVSGSGLLSLLIGLGWIAWEFAILAYGVIVFSRYVFAMGFDRFLPEKFAHISSRWGSPVSAHLFDLIVTIGLIGAATFLYGPFSTLYGAVVAAMIYFAFVGVAAVIYALRHEHGSGKAWLGISGGLTAVIFAFITYEFFAYAHVWGGNALAYGYEAAAFIIGLALYAFMKSRSRAKGVDIRLAFREIPPD